MNITLAMAGIRGFLYRDYRHFKESPIYDEINKQKEYIVNYSLNILDMINKKYGTNLSHSLLFNPSYEQYDDEKLDIIMNDLRFDKSFADSGGLQALTIFRNKNIDKEKIYENQKIADYQFCFDDLPYFVEEGWNNKKVTFSINRWIFDRAGFKQRIQNTIDNIYRQIDVFQKEKSLYVIIQGKDYDTYNEWLSTMLEEFEGNKHIAGYAFKGAGTSSFNMLEGIYLCTQKIPKDYNIHLLGAASKTKCLALFTAIKHGLMDKYPLVSFDSKSLSMSLSYGIIRRYDMKSKDLKIYSRFGERNMSAFVDDILFKFFIPVFRDIGIKRSYYDKYMSLSKVSRPETYYRNKFGNDWYKDEENLREFFCFSILSRRIYMLFDILNFFTFVGEFITNKTSYKNEDFMIMDRIFEGIASGTINKYNDIKTIINNKKVNLDDVKMHSVEDFF